MIWDISSLSFLIILLPRVVDARFLIIIEFSQKVIQKWYAVNPFFQPLSNRESVFGIICVSLWGLKGGPP